MTNALTTFNFGFDRPLIYVQIAEKFDDDWIPWIPGFPKNFRIWVCEAVKQGDIQADNPCKMFYSLQTQPALYSTIPAASLFSTIIKLLVFIKPFFCL